MPARARRCSRTPRPTGCTPPTPAAAASGSTDGRMMVPRGKMLGGSSGINYMAYVRGHPGDFDSWAAGGATGWSYDDVLPYFKKSEGLAPSGDIVVDADAHNTEGPLGVSVRAPVLTGAQEFVDAAVAAGIPRGRLQRPRPRRARRGGVAPADHDPRRQAVEHVPRVPRRRGRAATEPRGDLRGARHQGGPRGRGRRAAGDRGRVPHRRRRDGRRPGRQGGGAQRRSGRLAPHPDAVRHRAAGASSKPSACRAGSTLPTSASTSRTTCRSVSLFPAPGVGVSMSQIGLSMGPDALRAPAGPLPADPADDADLPEELQALKAEAERRVTEWATTGHGLVSSSLYEACAWFSTGLGDDHTHDAQLGFFICGYNHDIWRGCLRVDPDEYFDDPDAASRPRRRVGDRPRQPGAAPQRGRDRPRQRRPARPSRHPHELLRRPPRHGGHGRRASPGARRRGATGPAHRDARPAARPAGARRQARPRRRATPRATSCSRTWPATTRSPCTT